MKPSRKPDKVDAVFGVIMLLLVGLIVTFAAVSRPGPPEVVTVTVPDPYIPAVCVRALKLADEHVTATAVLVATVNSVAPLVADAYVAGAEGDDARTLEKRIKNANGDIADAYGEATRLRSGYDQSVARCLLKAGQ